jgi:GNAT superfamily N-acetyltransferase
VLFRKYPRLGAVRVLPDTEAELGSPAQGSNDWVDNQLLVAVKAGAVDFLVTEDQGVHRKAARIGIADLVLTAADARQMLATLVPGPPASLPSIEWISAAEIDDDPIFDSVREDYPDFDEWLATCRKEGRDTCVIHAPDGSYAAISILTPKDKKFGVRAKWLKICQLKVADPYRGRRYGELLLKAVFDYRLRHGFDAAYLTVFDKYDGLIRLLKAYGFDEFEGRSDRGEMILTKPFRPTASDLATLDPLTYHVRFGPPALKPAIDRTYVIPIRPEYHRSLFPEAERRPGAPQLSFGFAEPDVDHPFGNAIRKAYLCHSPSNQLVAGSTIVFYRSEDLHALTVVGVVEQTARLETADEITRMVGNRTVYSLKQIEHMAAEGPVLVILFRQDRVLGEPISLAECTQRQLLSSWPMSITAVRRSGFEWLSSKIAE